MLSALYAVVVCLSVCVSVTLRYCIKTAKRSITQITPHDSPMFSDSLSFSDATDHGEFERELGGLKLVTFVRCLVIKLGGQYDMIDLR